MDVYLSRRQVLGRMFSESVGDKVRIPMGEDSSGCETHLSMEIYTQIELTRAAANADTK